MDSRNEYVRSIYHNYCGWGKRIIVVHETPYKGGFVPIFKNVGTKIQNILSMVSFVFLITCIVELVIL